MAEDKKTISFENIQCIKKASNIAIYENCINVKYGFNGLGKSSLGKACVAFIKNDQAKIDCLRPFDKSGIPGWSGDTSAFSSVTLFDRDYISENLLKKKTEIVSRAEVFFSNPAIQQGKDSITNYFQQIKNLLDEVNMKNLVIALEATKLPDNINQKSKDVKDNTDLGKGLAQGVAYSEIYEDDILKYFDEFFKLVNHSEWIEWHEQASNNSDWVGMNRCPYCGQEYSPTLDKNLVTSPFKVKSEKDAKVFNKTIEIFVEIKKFVGSADKKLLDDLIAHNVEPDDAAKSALYGMILPLSAELGKLNKLTNFLESIKLEKIDPPSLIKQIESFKLDTNFFKNISDPRIDANVCENSAIAINGILDNLVNNITPFYDLIKKYNDDVSAAIDSSKKEINAYLKLAGIPYEFDVKFTKGQAKTYVIPNDSKENIEPDKCFSYGEQNSFAMALFGALCKHSNEQLVILDDPISSFDDNKKYAVLHFLLNSYNGMLKGKTVLILTHDNETLYDLLSLYDLCPFATVKGFLLDKDSNGEVTEKEIFKKDIIPFFENEKALAESDETEHPLISRLIHFRRYKEMSEVGYKRAASYAIISSITKSYPIDQVIYIDPDDTSKKTAFTDKDYVNGDADIQTIVKDFSRTAYASKYDDIEKLFNEYDNRTDNYDKMVILRAIVDYIETKKIKTILNVYGNKVTKSFLNEAFHFENEATCVFQSNNSLPPYIYTLFNEYYNEIKTAYFDWKNSGSADEDDENSSSNGLQSEGN